jgi:hypothetical protein
MIPGIRFAEFLPGGTERHGIFLPVCPELTADVQVGQTTEVSSDSLFETHPFDGPACGIVRSSNASV